MRNPWSTLVSDNPMMIEAVRAYRRMMNPGGRSSSNAMFWVVGALYIIVLVFLLNFIGDIPPIVLIYIQLFVFSIAPVTSMYSAIAGERENRTWDLLVSAPVTKAQIVAGKYIGGLTSVGAVTALFLVPILLMDLGSTNTNEPSTFLAETMVVSFAAFLGAFTLFVSSRTDRPFTALAICLGFLAVFLIVIPALASVISMGGDSDLIQFFHPYFALSEPFFADTATTNYTEGWGFANFYCWPQTLLYLGLTVVLLIFTTSGLVDSDRMARRTGN